MLQKPMEAERGTDIKASGVKIPVAEDTRIAHYLSQLLCLVIVGHLSTRYLTTPLTLSNSNPAKSL